MLLLVLMNIWGQNWGQLSPVKVKLPMKGANPGREGIPKGGNDHDKKR